MSKQASSRVQIPESLMLRAKAMYLELLGEKGSGSEVAAVILEAWVSPREASVRIHEPSYKAHRESLIFARKCLAEEAPGFSK